MQPLALAIASGCISHRKRLRWLMDYAAFFVWIFNDAKPIYFFMFFMRNPPYRLNEARQQVL